MNDVSSAEIVKGNRERPFYLYQKQGYFPWRASFEGRAVGEEINNTIGKIPGVARRELLELRYFYEYAMTLSALTYTDSFIKSKFKPVYHGTNPKAGTPEALKSKFCGHQEASSLFAASLYVGACIKGDLKFNPREFKAVVFASLVHEMFDWYEPTGYSKIFF